jgi:Spy/CpxP family protein refolding chaperone
MFRRAIIITSLVLSFAGVAALAQSGGQRAAGRNGFAGQLRGNGARRDRLAGKALERLQQTLNLSETQMNGVRALAENRRRETESLQQELQQKRQTLRQLLQQPNPNPYDVGNATIALKESREATREINQRFLSGFKALLTPEQLEKLPKRFAK